MKTTVSSLKTLLSMSAAMRSRLSIKRGLLFLAGLLVCVGLFAIASPAWAFIARGGEHVTIAADQVIEEDLYLAGNTVTVDGTVRGDATIAARQITINGTVEGDLAAAGQTITVNGTINDDARIMGQILTLGEQARIGDDVMAAGASLESKAGSTIAGELSFGGAQALLAGTVAQDVVGGMSALELRGAVNRDVRVNIGSGDRRSFPFLPQSQTSRPQIQPGLTVIDSAQIGGKLIYQSPTQAAISPGAQIANGVEYNAVEPSRPIWLPAFYIAQWFLTLLFVGCLLLWLVPNWTQGLASTIATKPLPSLGWGVVVALVVGALAIAIPIVTLLLTMLLGVTISGLAPLVISLGILAHLTLIIGFLLFIGYVPPVVASYLIGRGLLRSKQLTGTLRWLVPLAIGLIIFVALTAIPIVGSIINLLVILLGLGALWNWNRTKRSPEPTEQLVGFKPK